MSERESTLTQKQKGESKYPKNCDDRTPLQQKKKGKLQICHLKIQQKRLEEKKSYRFCRPQKDARME